MSEPPLHQPTLERRNWACRALRVLIVWPAPGLAAASLIGLGLSRGLPGGLAFAFAAALAVFPVLGLRSLLPNRSWALPLAAWLWGTALMASIPLYFPGEQRQAAEVGVRTLTLFTGKRSSTTLGEAAGRLAVWLGGQDDKSITSPTGSIRLPEPIRAEPTQRPVSRDPEPQRADRTESIEPQPIILSYEGDNRSLRIDVGVDGPEVGERYDMILDTGATFSTLSTEALHGVGLSVPTDAPWVQLQTAGGMIEAPLVLLDAVWLGDFPVEWVTIAVCEECSSPAVVGLLGLNVLQRFRLAIDHERQQIELHRRERDFDRQVDIGHWLEVESQVTSSSTGNVELVLRSHNRARQAIRTAVIDLDCSGEGFAIQLDYIPARGEASTRAELPPGTNCQEQKLRLSRAHWVEDRFDEP